MTRKELYEIIKDNNLNDEIIKTFGSDYTHVTNAGLEQYLIDNAYICTDGDDDTWDEAEEYNDEVLIDIDDFSERLETLEAKFDRLMEMLADARFSEDEIDYINDGE